MAADGGDELVELRFGEAIEEKVSGDEIEGGAGGEGGESGEGVGVVEGEASGGKGAAAGEELKHGATGIYDGDKEAGIAAEEGGKKAAVAIAEDEGVAGGDERAEMLGAGAGERGPQGEVLEQAIGPGDAIEVGSAQVARRGCGGEGHQRRRSQGRTSAGVRRARSAAARRVNGER